MEWGAHRSCRRESRHLLAGSGYPGGIEDSLWRLSRSAWRPVRPAVAPSHDDETMGIIDIGTTRKNARGNAEAFRRLAEAALVRRQSRRRAGAGGSKASLSHTPSSTGRIGWR